MVENVFGILANRFEVFMQPIALAPTIVESLVLACAAMHNYLRIHIGARAVYSPSGSSDCENTDTGEIQPGNWGNEQSKGWSSGSISQVAGQQDAVKDIRKILCGYFNSPTGEYLGS